MKMHNYPHFLPQVVVMVVVVVLLQGAVVIVIIVLGLLVGMLE